MATRVLLLWHHCPLIYAAAPFRGEAWSDAAGPGSPDHPIPEAGDTDIWMTALEPTARYEIPLIGSVAVILFFNLFSLLPLSCAPTGELTVPAGCRPRDFRVLQRARFRHHGTVRLPQAFSQRDPRWIAAD